VKLLKVQVDQNVVTEFKCDYISCKKPYTRWPRESSGVEAIGVFSTRKHNLHGVEWFPGSGLAEGFQYTADCNNDT
jgi:hypothetical protein